ncbi:MAG: FtsW/RodA/SpoVE family cell cycle protein [Lachnospiraceae bacterium]|nr:FtsW/RodA/SpoVE family cell cycle protein [Lachnospiraceae bacterium]
MASFISETSNYLFVWIILFYVITNVVVFFFKNPEEHKHFYAFQFIIAILFHAVGYITLFMRSEDLKYFFFFAFQEIIIIAIVMIYLTIYPSISRLLLNNMIFLLDVSFIILGRLAFENALRQFSITIVLLIVSLFVPVIYIKNKGWRNVPYLYCTVGIISLAAVWITGSVTHGSKLNIEIWGFNFQPSEFVKISIIFFMAALLSQKKNKLKYVLCTMFMLVHVMILVLSKDLGSAGIYLITYIFMIFLASRSPLILPAGAALSVGAFTFAYKEFAHVRVRVHTWLNPFEDVENTGWQLSQSLFAIGTGGWFGMGLLQGYPKSIPYVEEDFIFSAIGEEMGVLFSVLLILLYLFTALHIIRYSYHVKSDFHRLLLYGFAVCFAVQVFVTIGGGTRLIPLTGVTLPLISMGGSSLCTTVLMFSIIQGIYVKEFDYKNLSKEVVEEEELDEDFDDEVDEDEAYEEENEEYDEVNEEYIEETQEKDEVNEEYNDSETAEPDEPSYQTVSSSNESEGLTREFAKEEIQAIRSVTDEIHEMHTEDKEDPFKDDIYEPEDTYEPADDEESVYIDEPDNNIDSEEEKTFGAYGTSYDEMINDFNFED